MFLLTVLEAYGSPRVAAEKNVTSQGEDLLAWIKVAAALNSAGTEMAIVYQKFHPVAAPNAGSMKAVAWRTNPPVTGMKAVISPVV